MEVSVAVEALCASSTGQQGALSVRPQGSVGGCLKDRLLSLQLETAKMTKYCILT